MTLYNFALGMWTFYANFMPFLFVLLPVACYRAVDCVLMSKRSRKRSGRKEGGGTWIGLGDLTGIEEPSGLQGSIKMKRISNESNRWHNMDATLSRGWLKLFKSERKDGKVAALAERINVCDAQIRYNADKRMFEFVSNGRKIYLRVDKKDMITWLTNLQAHHIFRKLRQLRRTDKDRSQNDDKKRSTDETKEIQKGKASLEDLRSKCDRLDKKLRVAHKLVKDMAKTRQEFSGSGDISQSRSKELLLTYQLAARDMQDIETVLRRSVRSLKELLEGAYVPVMKATEQEKEKQPISPTVTVPDTHKLLEEKPKIAETQKIMEEQKLHEEIQKIPAPRTPSVPPEDLDSEEKEKHSKESLDSEESDSSDEEEEVNEEEGENEMDDDKVSQLPSTPVTNSDETKFEQPQTPVKTEEKTTEKSTLPKLEEKKISPPIEKPVTKEIHIEPKLNKEIEKVVKLQKIEKPTVIVEHRRKLPAHAPPSPKISITNIGSLIRRTPIGFFEPITVPQMLCETMENSQLLDMAANEQNNIDRLLLVAAFAVCGYSAKLHRTKKPFDPMMGETFECDKSKEFGWRFIAESVSISPDITTCHVDGTDWTFWETMRLTLHTTLSGIEIRSDPDFFCGIRLPKFDETYIFRKVTSSVHNLLKPHERFVGFYGDMSVQCIQSKLKCQIIFDKSTGKLRTRKVHGRVTKGGIFQGYNLEGKWAGDLFKVDHKGAKTCIFHSQPVPIDIASKYYGFGPFALELNELSEELKKNLPPNDSRFRPDTRLMEEGKFEEADKLRNHLENKQKERMKNLKQQPHRPLWFVPDQSSTGSKKAWITNGMYWSAKDNNFNNTNLPHIW